MRGEQVLFCIGGHPVKLWDGYGAVCPDLWTTNGSIPFLARLVSGHHRASPEYNQITDATIEADWDDEESVKAALMAAWERFTAKLIPPTGPVTPVVSAPAGQPPMGPVGDSRPVGVP